MDLLIIKDQEVAKLVVFISLTGALKKIINRYQQFLYSQVLKQTPL
jgi:hypothetical protein